MPDAGRGPQVWRAGMAPLLTAALGGLPCSALQAQVQRPGPALLAPGLFVSQDSDDFLVQKAAAGVAPSYRSGNDYTLIKAARHRYAAPTVVHEATQLSLVRQLIDAHTGLGLQASGGYNRLGERGLLTAEIDYARALGSSTTGGVLFVRDWVETSKALSEGVSHNFLGISLEQRLAPRWGAHVLLAQQHFSDENIRKHVRLRLSHELWPEQGLNLQYRHRHYWNSAASGNYFSPDVYYEDMLTLGLRRPVLGWRLAATLGVGSQRVSSAEPTATHLAELEVASPVAGAAYFRTRLGYSDSAGLGGPDYRYRYLQAELLIRF